MTAALLVGLSAGGPARADDGMKAEIEMLKDRLAKLEAQLANQQAAAAGAPEGSAVVSLPSGLHGIELSGFVDTAYSYNFAGPDSRLNTLRGFDRQANSFVLHNAQLNLGKSVSSESPLGFKVSLMYGDDAELTHSTGLTDGTGVDPFDLQQAYVEYLAPLGEGLSLKAGKMATLIGAEVIESPANWNYSRSTLFFYAIPFTHTGVRASYPLTEQLTLTTGVNNGWDIADDSFGNTHKGVEGQVAWAPMEGVSLYLNGMFSPESTAANSYGDRWIGDVVASYTPIDPLTLMVNYDFGSQEDAAAVGTDADWQGVAAYAKYDLTDKWSVAGRYGFFDDEDGFRTGTTDLEIQDVTLTTSYKVHEHLLARLEYRHDHANQAVYADDADTTDKDQDTIAVEFIMPF
jgi:hypothetical protein